MTIVSENGMVVTQTWRSADDSYTESTTYTSVSRTNIASEVTTDVNGENGLKTVTTINYNPGGSECTFNQSVTSSVNPNDLIGGAGGTETQSGTVQTLSISGTGFNATLSGAAINISAGASAAISGHNNTITQNAGSTVTLDSSDSNTVENAVTGQQFTISDGTISASGNNGPLAVARQTVLLPTTTAQ